VTISFVTMTWNRSGQRITNLLASLLVYGTKVPSEVIIVDTSNEPWHAASVARSACPYGITVIHKPRGNLYKAWALNVGLLAARSDYIAVTDIDMMFGPHLVEALETRLERGAQFVMADVRGLPESVAGMTLGHEWLVEQSEPWPGDGRGTLQCAPAGWWYYIRGYDERFAEGLGGVEDDVFFRARQDNRRIEWIPFDEGQVLHQWHPKSPLKGKTLHLKDTGGQPVVRNERGWGE